MIDSFTGEYRFLSNFYPSEIEYQGIKYPTNEHFYVGMKVNDPQIISKEASIYLKNLDISNDGAYSVDEIRRLIAQIPTSGKVKRFGRLMKLRQDWDDVRLKVMNYGVRQKFTKHENLKHLLLSTGDERLIEGNTWHDNFFGTCSCSKCGNKGKNHLGKILMTVRDEIIW